MSNAEGARAAQLFAALGDPTRLAIVQALADGKAHSIADLSALSPMSRQGLTKHLLILERAGLVAGARRGRRTRFSARKDGVLEAKAFLDLVARQWEGALLRLKDFAES